MHIVHKSSLLGLLRFKPKFGTYHWFSLTRGSAWVVGWKGGGAVGRVGQYGSEKSRH